MESAFFAARALAACGVTGAVGAADVTAMAVVAATTTPPTVSAALMARRCDIFTWSLFLEGHAGRRR
jgi:hypothetical protein